MADAKELTQFALAAIDEKDGDLAIERLQQAIECLHGMFGVTGKKKKHSKSALADARELTQFSLAAIHEKDGDLAIERLQQAIACLQNS